MSNWFINRNDKTYGPFDDRQLKSLALSGKLNLKDHIRREDLQIWKEAQHIVGLFSEPESVKPKPKRKRLRFRTALKYVGVLLLIFWLIGYFKKNPDRLAFSTAPLQSSSQEAWGLVGKNGEVLIPCSLDWLGNFSNGEARFQQDGKYGLIDKNGKVLLRCDSQDDIPNGRGLNGSLAERPPAQEDDKHEEIDPNIRTSVSNRGAIIISYYQPTGVYLIHENYGEYAGQTLLTDSNFNFIRLYSNKYSFTTERFDEKGWIRYLNLEGYPVWGMIDSMGSPVISGGYEFLGEFVEGFAVAKPQITYNKNTPQYLAVSKYGYIDRSDNWAIPPRFDSATPFSEGLAGVQSKGKWGFIDRSGDLVIDCIYDKVDAASGFRSSRGAFVEGRAGVCVGGKWGFIDRNGHYIVQPIYQEIEPFVGGVARVRK